MSTHLKPCPFCGGEAAPGTATITRLRTDTAYGTFTGYFVNCIICGADNKGICEGYSTPELAAEKWNARFADSENEGSASSPC